MYFSFLLAALVVAPNANAQGGLNLNQTYRDVIRLDFPAGKTQIPLPEGKWELLGLQEDQASDVTRVWRVYLARVEDNILLGQVTFNINADLVDWGWAPSSFCDKDNLYFIEVKSNNASDVDCWAVAWYRQNPNKPRSEGWQQMFNTLIARNVTVLRKMIAAAYQRRNTDNYLALYYHFNPYPPGNPSVTPESLKSWARDWKPKVDAGFLGKLEVTKTKETLAPPAQTPKPGTSRPRSDIKVILRVMGLSDLEAFQEAKNYIGTNCLGIFERYEKRHSSELETAFAYAQESLGGRYACGGSQSMIVENAKDRALYKCERAREKHGVNAPCEILAIGNKIVWEGKTVRSK